MNQVENGVNKRIMQNFEEEPEKCKFDKPDIAHKILQKLDIFESYEPADGKSSGYNRPFWSLIANDNYCDEHRAFFVQNPRYVFDNKDFLTDYWTHRLRKNVIPSIGRDVHPRIGHGMRNAFSNITEMSVEVNIFYTNWLMFWNRKIGKQFSCLTQISNHIPNHERLSFKDALSEAMVEYQNDYKSRPQCLNSNKFFPKTWVMYNEEQCREFFEEFNSLRYVTLKKERRIVYLRKIGAEVHEAMGVFPVDDKEEIYIRELYKNGTACGRVQKNNIMQYFVHNPLLVEGRKFDFRVYMFIASTNPMIAYYHDGFLKISLHDYNVNSEELGVFLTNTALSKPLFAQAAKNGKYNGMTLKELKDKSYWSYNDLFEYLMRTGQISDVNWINNHLRSELKKVMVHLVRMAQAPFAKKSSISELYGVDFVMDSDFNLWFIEANPRPMIEGWTPETVPFFNKMLTDSFEILFGLLRSRTKRIINYVNDIIRESGSWELNNDGLRLDFLEERREEFRQLSMNCYEPEYRPSTENGFYQIIDENYGGDQRYYGLPEECF